MSNFAVPPRDQTENLLIPIQLLCEYPSVVQRTVMTLLNTSDI